MCPFHCVYICTDGVKMTADREFGMVMYTLLFVKWVTKKDLLYSTRNSAQCYVAAWMGGEFGGEWIHIYVWLSPSAVNWLFSKTK